MSKYVMGQSSKRAQVWLQRVVKFWLASGMIAMPWMAYGSEIVRSDGASKDTHSGNMYNIYAGKDLGNNIGASSFSKFNITAGDVANMQFRQSASHSTTQFNTLLNFVDSKININGTVNAIREGGVGGHLYFLSPNGMAVGAGGVINAGALTVLTPTTDWWSKRSDSKGFALGQFNKDGSNDLTALTNMLVPINALGTIAVQGQINVTNDLRMKAGKINIGTDSEGKNYTAAVLKSGVVNFGSVVNLNDDQRRIAKITNLSATREASSGDIIIAAEANLAENFKDVDFSGLNKSDFSDLSKVSQKTKDFINNCMEFGDTARNKFTGYKINAEVNIVGGSDIIAAKDVKVSAIALNSANYSEYSKVVEGGGSAVVKSVDGQYVDASKFKDQYQNDIAQGFAFGSKTKVDATVNITNDGAKSGKNTTLTGLHTNVKAYASNTYETNNNTAKGQQQQDPAKKKDSGTILPKLSWNDVNSLFDGLDVVYGDLTSNATVTIGEHTVLEATGTDLSGAVTLQILAQSETKLTLGVKNTTPKAGESISTVPGMGVIVGLTNNNAVVNMGGTLKTEPTGNVEIKAVSDMDTSAKANMGFISKSDKEILDFGVVVQYGYNDAVVNIKNTANLKDSVKGNVAIDAQANNKIVSENLVLANANENAIVFAVSVTDYNSNAEVNVDSDINARNITIDAKSRYTDNSFNVNIAQRKDLNLYAAQTQQVTTTSQQNNLYKGKVKSFLVNGLGALQNTSVGSYLNSLKQKLSAGISFGYISESNVSNITIGNVSLKADEILAVHGLSEVEDINAKVNGTNANRQVSGTDAKQYLANGAILISNFENDSDITIAGGTKDKHAVLKAAGGKNVLLEAKAIVPYNRINRMVSDLTKFTDMWKKCIKDLKGEGGDQDKDLEKLEAAYADFEKKVKDLQTQMYDEKGKLKPEYRNSSDGYSKTVSTIEEYTKDPSFEKFVTLLNGQDYTYTDDQGRKQTISISEQGKGENGILQRLLMAWADGMQAYSQLNGLIGAAKKFANPANYLNFYVGNGIYTSVHPKDAKYAASVTVNYNAFTDNARVNVGKNAEINSESGDVQIDTMAESVDVALTGKLSSVGGAEKGVIGIAVGVNNIDNNSLITLAEGAKVTAYNDVSLHGDNKTVHIGIGEQYGKGSDVSATGVGVVLIVDGDSNTLVTVDDEAKINAGTSNAEGKGVISLKADNTTTGVLVAGGLATGGKAGMALSFGMLDISRQTFAAIVDNDDVASAGDYADDDKDQVRIKKILKKSNNKENFYGTAATKVEGSFEGIALNNLATSGGDLVNIVADVGMAGNGTKAENLGSNVSNKAGEALNTTKNNVANSKAGEVGFVKTLTNSDGAANGETEAAPAADAAGQDADVEQAQDEAPAPASADDSSAPAPAAPLLAAGGNDTQESSNDQDAPAPADDTPAPTAGSVAGAGNSSKLAGSQPAAPSVMEGDDQTGGGSTTSSFSLAGTGSVAINQVKARTGAIIDGTTISLKPQAGGTVNNIAMDKGTIVSIAGGVSISNRKNSGCEGEQGDSKSISAAAGAAVNLVTSYNNALINNTTFKKVNSIDNEAQRSGALAAAAAAVDVASNSKDGNKGVAAGGSVSVNIGNYTNNAVLNNNIVNVTDPKYKTTLFNKALDKDLQVTGALNTNLAIGGKKGVSVGAVVSWGIINNDVTATMNGGTYNYMGAVTNTAVTDLTQIQAAIGFGLSKSKERSISVEGSAAVGQTKNTLTATVNGVEVNADSFFSKAYDTLLTGIKGAGDVWGDKKFYTFDTTGAGYITDAAGETSEDGIKDGTYKDEGNTMVSAAVQITAAVSEEKDKSNVAIGAAVAVNTLDNVYQSKITNSTINAGTVETISKSNSLNVGVAAGGNGTGKGFAGSGSVVAGVYNDQISATVEGSKLTADTVKVLAENKEKAVNVAGTVSIATSGSVVGLDMAYNYFGTATSALLKNTTVGGNTSALTVKATNDAKMYAVAVAVAAGVGKAAASGSVAINRGHNDVSAVAESETDDNSTLSLSDFTVETLDNTNLTAAAGGLDVAFGKEAKAAIGGSVALNALGTGKKVDASGKLVSDNKTQLNQAKVIGYNITKLTGAMKVQAIDTAKITTVGVGLGLAGMDSYVAFQGTDATTLLDKDTKAKVLNTNINKDASNQGTLNVKASTKNTIKAYSLVFEGKLGKAAIGIALAQNLMNADTGVTIAGGTYKLADVLAKADSEQKLSNYTVGMAAGLSKATIGGSVVVNTMDNDTTATLGYDDGNKVTNVNTTGSTGVISSSSETYENYSGQINIGLSKNAVGGGAAVAVNKFEGDTIAKAQNAVINTGVKGNGVKVHDSIADEDNAYKGLVVDADAYHKLYNAPFSGGLTISTGTVALGLDAVVSVDSIKGATKALVNSVALNEGKTSSIDGGNNLTVLATDKVDLEAVVKNVVASLDLKGAGLSVACTLGAGVSSDTIDRTTEAKVAGDSKRKKIYADKLTVKADSLADLDVTNTAVSLAVAVGSTAIAGSVNAGVIYTDMESKTNATVSGVESCNNGLTIEANHKDDVDLTGTAVTVAVAVSTDPSKGIGVATALGVAVSSENNQSETIALLDSSKVYHYTDAKSDDVIQAVNTSNITSHITDVAVGVGVIGAGIGVLVADNNIQQVVQAKVNNSVIGTADKRANDIKVLAENNVNPDSWNINEAAGTVGIGVIVGLNTTDASTAADVYNSTFYAANDVDVKADETIDASGKMYSVSAGALAVGVSVMHNYSHTVVEDEDYVNWNDKNVSKDKLKKNEYSAKKVDGLRMEMLNSADKIVKGVSTDTNVPAAEGTMKVTPVERPTTKISNSGTKVNIVNSNLNAGHDIKALAHDTVKMDSFLGGGAIGVAAVQVQSNRQRVTSDVGTNVTGGSWVAGNDIYVQANLDGDLKNGTIQAGVGGAVVSVTIGESTKYGDTAITLDNASMQAKDITVKAQDELGILATGTTVNVAGVGANAALYTATDNATTSVTLANSTGASTLIGDTVTVNSLSTPAVRMKFTAAAVALVAGCGTVMTAAANNQANLTVADGTKFDAGTVDLKSSLHSRNKSNAAHDGYAIYNEVNSVSVSGVAVNVNKAEVKTDVKVKTTVGAIVLKDDTNLKVVASDSMKIYNSITGITLGVIATGTNYAISDLKSDVVTAFNAGSTGVSTKKITVSAHSSDNLTSKANGDGGGVVDISPDAAHVKTMIDGKTTTTLTGKFTTSDVFDVTSVRDDKMRLLADAVNAQVVGGSGVNNEIEKFYENTTTNVKDATINSNSRLNLEANTNVKINEGENDYALKGNGFGGFDASVGNIRNKNMKLNTKVNIDSSNIYGNGLMNIEAYTNTSIFLSNWVFSVGVLSGNAEAVTESDITITDEVNITDSKGTGTEIRSNSTQYDMTIGASDNDTIFLRSYSEAASGVIGAVSPKAKNTITRNNKVNISGSKTVLHSNRDVNLYANKRTNEDLGYMDVSTKAEYYNGNLIPASIDPTVNINIKQNNQIKVDTRSQVRGIRHVNLYAANGRESVQKVAKTHSMYGNDDKGSCYVSTTTGNLNDAGISRDNYVWVDGAVIAGVANKLHFTIGSDKGDIVALGADELVTVKNKSAENGNRPIYGIDDKAEFVHLYDSEESKYAAEISGITLDSFKLDSFEYSDSLIKRYEEVNAMMSEYINDKDQSVYNGLLAEAQRLEGLIAALKATGNDGSSTQGINPNNVEYIQLPNLVASGGNVVVDTQNFRGSGKVEAKGSPDITVTNYTNLMLVTGKAQVFEPGGIITYNSKTLDPNSTTATMQKQVQNINANKNLTVADLAAAEGTTATINIIGYYDGREILFGGKNYLKDDKGNKIAYDSNNPMKDQSGNDIAHDEYYYEEVSGSYKPKADIRIAGSLNSSKGEVNILSKHNDITISGWKARDKVVVSGKKIDIKADNGSITQGFTDGIVSIGNDVKALYQKLYDEFVNKNKNKDSTYEIENAIEVEPEYNGDWIAGGQVCINATDINVNGIIQSGFDSYTAELTDADQKTIDNIINKWNSNGRQALTDAQVRNGGNTYLVKGGGATYDSAKGYFVYKVDVYYNPSTNELVTDDVGASGGRVYLTGRISSTGNGKVFCLDGAYDISITNTLPYDLRVGALAVNDTKGLITITNTGSGLVTEITSSGAKTRHLKTREEGKDSHVSGSGKSYKYTPDSGIRYNWVTGYSNVSYKKYTKEYMAKWWGADDYKMKAQDVLDSWVSSSKPAGSATGADTERGDGVYISTNSNPFIQKFAVYFQHNSEETGHTTKQLGQPDHWSTGYLGCHKWTSYTYQQEIGHAYSDSASIKGDYSIDLQFIGKKAEDSIVTVDTVKDLYISGQIGNSQLYEVMAGDGKTVIGHAEKGTVNLISHGESIVQNGSSIYGANVNLSAKEDLRNINITAGDTVNLKGELAGTGSANINVKAAYGGAKGNVALSNLGGINASVVDLKAAGNITQNSGVSAQAKRINLTSGGSITGADGNPFYLIAGQTDDADTTDPLKASVNISAESNIYIEQKTGDLRVGTIYSSDGDVTINVPGGSIIDALPYEKSQDQDTDAKLLATWKSMGLIDLDTTTQKERSDTLDAGEQVYDKYVQNVKDEYQKYTEIKAKEEDQRTDAEKDLFVRYDKIYSSYDSADAYLEADTRDDKLKAEAEAAKKVGDYKGWDKNALLYELQDSVINPKPGVELPKKNANISGNNITLNVLHSVGLNSENVEKVYWKDVNAKTEDGLKNLKKLAAADPGIVTFDEDEDGKYACVTEKLAMGVHQKDGNGRIIVNKYDGAVDEKNNVYLETRKATGSNDEYLGLNIGSINIVGDVRLTSLESLTSDNVITANDVALMVGVKGGNNGNIGSSSEYFKLNMDGALIATATGDIYIESVSEGDLHVATMTAGAMDGEKTTEGGHIYLKALGNICSIEQKSDFQGYIRSGNGGSITLESSNGSIGDHNRPVWIYNGLLTEEEAKDFTGENKDKGIVILSAAKDIYVEGVSTAPAIQRMNPDGTPVMEEKKYVYDQAPGGYFKLQSVSLGGETVSITVNGQLTYGNELDLHDKDVYLGITSDFYMDGSLKVKSLMVCTGNDFIMTNGSKITASENAAVVAGTVPDISYGPKVKLTKEGGRVEQKEGQAVDAGIVSPYLAVEATGGIILNGANRTSNLLLQNGKEDISFTNYSAADDILNVAIFSTNADISSFDVDKEDQYILGKITLKNKALAGETESGNIAVFYGVAARDGIYMEAEGGDIYNSSGVAAIAGDVTLKAADIYNHGDVLIKEAGNVDLVGSGLISNEGNIAVKQGNITIRAEERIDNSGDIKVIEKGNAGVTSLGSCVSNTGDISIGDGMIEVTAQTDLENIGNIEVFDNTAAEKRVVWLRSVRGGLENSGDIYAHGTGNVEITAMKDVGNAGCIAAEKGEVYITASENLHNYRVEGVITKVEGIYGGKGVTIAAGHNVNNEADIYASDGGVLISGAAKVVNRGNIFSMDGGAVKLVAIDDDLENYGDIFTHDNDISEAEVVLMSGKGNVINEDDFKAEEEVLKKYAKNPVVGVIAAQGDITLSAPEGEIDNSKALVATGDITIKSLKNIYLQDSDFKSDDELQTELGVTWIKGITAGGDVTIESTNVYNSMEITAGGDINIIAKAERDAQNNVIAETGVVKIYGKNGKFISGNGGITITADGYTRVEDYKNVLLTEAKEERFSIRNLGNNDLIAKNGKVALIGTYSLENVGDIEAGSEGVTLTAGKDNTYGNVYNYEYGDAAFDIKQGTYTGASGKGTSKYINDKGEEVIVNNVEHSINSKGNIEWSVGSGSIYNVSGQYADDNVTFNLDDIGVNIKKIGAGKNVTLVQTNPDGQVTFVSTIISGGDVTFDVKGSLLLGEDSGVYVGKNLTLYGDAGVRSRLALIAGENIVVQSDKGDVVLEKSVISSAGVVNISAAGELRLGSEPEEVQNDVPVLNMAKLMAAPAPEAVDTLEDIFVLRADSSVSLKAGTSVVVDGQIITDKEGVVVDAATGNITVTGDIDAKTSALLTANNDIAFTGNVTTGTDNLKMLAGNDVKFEGNINAKTSAVLAATNNIGFEGNVITCTDNVDMLAGNDVKLEGNIDAYTSVIMNALNDISVIGNIDSLESTYLNAGNNVTMSGDITSANKDVNLSAQEGSIKYSGNITATKGLAAVGTENGAELILKDGTITGNKVVLYTESGDTQMGFDKAVVGQELTLAGNHWNKDWGEMFDVVMENGYNIRLYSAGRTNDGAIYNLNFVDNTDHIFISEAVADTVKMRTDGTVTIQDLSVSNIAEITAMGTKTDVYGRMHEYDADAKVIYYCNGKGAGAEIDLHDMFFEGDPEIYQEVMDQYKQDSTTDFVTAGNEPGSGVDGNGRGMTLVIKSPTLQYGNGLLLRNYYGQTTKQGRYSLEQWMQHLLNLKAVDSYNEYFNKGIEIFQRYNLMEIPNVTVNQPVDLKDGSFEIEGTGTDKEGKKVVKKVKYQF